MEPEDPIMFSLELSNFLYPVPEEPIPTIYNIILIFSSHIRQGIPSSQQVFQ
jgi:hypothetical protein